MHGGPINVSTVRFVEVAAGPVYPGSVSAGTANRHLRGLAGLPTLSQGAICPMRINRRDCLSLLAAGFAAGPALLLGAQRPAPLVVKNVTITPIALPDPPLLAAGGCHGPYFLRNVIEL